MSESSVRELDAFTYRPGEINSNWHNRDDVEIVVVQFWTDARLRIKSVDENLNKVTFTGSSWRPLSWSKAWFAENVKEGLCEPGEWYLDRQTGVEERPDGEGSAPHRLWRADPARLTQPRFHMVSPNT